LSATTTRIAETRVMHHVLHEELFPAILPMTD